MNLGKNIQYLRKQKKFTQEQLSEHMRVSRQTVSRWESGEIVPELDKLCELCELFSVKLDRLVREDITMESEIYSAVTIKRVAPFTMARYVMITPNPESDVQAYMKQWAERSGLLEIKPDAMRIGWDFPYVSMEQQNRFSLRGYVCAYVLPEGFLTDAPGVEYAGQAEADYAVITVYEPFKAPFERIPNAYKKIMNYLNANGFKEKGQQNILSCFEHEYMKDGVSCMDVYIHTDGVNKADMYTDFV